MSVFEGEQSDNRQNHDKQKTCKRSWSQAEDEKLLKLVEDHGSINWSIIAENFDGRTGKQCRERYNNHLQPDIKKGDWTPEEDMIIVEMQAKYGNHWSKITKMLPGRTDNAIKNRWHAAVRATSRGTYTKDCGLLSNIRRQPVIPRLQLDTLSIPEKDMKFTPYSLSQQQMLVQPAHEQQHPIQGVEMLSLYSDTLMALAHEHTHHHITDDTDSSDDSSSVSESFHKQSSKTSTSTIPDQSNSNEILTARSGFSVNSVDLSTLISLTRNNNKEGHNNSIENNGRNIKKLISEDNVEMSMSFDFDWQSPRYLDFSPRSLPGDCQINSARSLADEILTNRQHTSRKSPRPVITEQLQQQQQQSSRIHDGGPMLKRFREDRNGKSSINK
eukprot:gene4198-8349_t